MNFPEAGGAPEPGTPGSRCCTTTCPGCWPRSTTRWPASGVNILGQSLATRGDQGYVVTDVAEAPDPATLEALRAMPHTVLLRAFSA